MPNLLDNCPLDLSDPTERAIVALFTACGILAGKAGDKQMVFDLLTELHLFASGRGMTDKPRS